MPGVQENLAAVRATAVALKLVGFPAFTGLLVGMIGERGREEREGKWVLVHVYG